jgi:oligosaccharide repeat unit polymerase
MVFFAQGGQGGCTRPSLSSLPLEWQSGRVEVRGALVRRQPARLQGVRTLSPMPGRAPGPWVPVALGLGSGLTVALINPRSTVEALLSVGAIIVVLAPPMLWRRSPDRYDWSNPLGLATFYMALVLLLPPAFVHLSNRSLGRLTPDLVTEPVLVVALLVVTTFMAGCYVGVRHVRTPQGIPVDDDSVTRNLPGYRIIRRGAILALSAVFIHRVTGLTQRIANTYGEGQTEFDAVSSIATATNLGFFMCVVILVAVNGSLHRTVLRWPEAVLVAGTTAVTLAGGDRSTVLAPLLFIAWAWHRNHRQVIMPVGVLIVFLVLITFQAATAYRSSGQLQVWQGSASLAENTLRAVSSPTLVTAHVVRLVPERHEYEYGSTYAAALSRQLPGPLARAIFGPPQGTGAFRYRELINYRNPDQGFGFAFSAEAYLNFGYFGAALVPLFLGMLFGYAWRMSRETHLLRARVILYPLLVTTLPYSIRSDALTQTKSVLYPVIAIWILQTIAPRLGGRRGASNSRDAFGASRPPHPEARRKAPHVDRARR